MDSAEQKRRTQKHETQRMVMDEQISSLSELKMMTTALDRRSTLNVFTIIRSIVDLGGKGLLGKNPYFKNDKINITLQNEV